MAAARSRLYTIAVIQLALSACASAVRSAPVSRPDSPLRGTQALQASSLFTDSAVAFVVYAPLNSARLLKCEALIDSLRSHGQWGGRIYFLVKAVDLKCYQHERWSTCGLSANIVTLPDGFGASSVHSKAGRGSSWHSHRSPSAAVQANLVHAHIWELLEPPAHVQTLVLLHGCDSLVGAPVRPFLQAVTQQLASPSPASHALQPPPSMVVVQAAGQQHSSLAWVVDQHRSHALLHALREEVLANTEVDEGRLLKAAVKRVLAHHGSAQRSGQVAEDAQAEQQQQQQGGSDSSRPGWWAGVLAAPTHAGWAQLVQCTDADACAQIQPAVFNHVPPSSCFSLDNEAVNDWVAGQDLCVLQGINYCLPLVMQPFALTWLPYPHCAKLELGLARVACQWSCTETEYMRTSAFRTTVRAAPEVHIGRA